MTSHSLCSCRNSIKYYYPSWSCSCWRHCSSGRFSTRRCVHTGIYSISTLLVWKEHTIATVSGIICEPLSIFYFVASFCFLFFPLFCFVLLCLCIRAICMPKTDCFRWRWQEGLRRVSYPSYWGIDPWLTTKLHAVLTFIVVRSMISCLKWVYWRTALKTSFTIITRSSTHLGRGGKADSWSIYRRNKRIPHICAGSN